MTRAVVYYYYLCILISFVEAFQVRQKRSIIQATRYAETAITTASTTSSSSTTPMDTDTLKKNSILDTFDYHMQDKLPWSEQGYQFWKWRDVHDIHYIEMGDKTKPALLLIHGFGASAYHFRYNIPTLARDYHVFAFDMLGFGLSNKPIQDYSAHVWKDQTLDFIQQVIQKPVIVAGNSLGGFTALFASASAGQHLIKGCILLNAAGRFRKDMSDDEEQQQQQKLDGENTKNNSMVYEIVSKVKEYTQRLIIWASFLYTKQPARIQQVLQQVYPVSPNMVDDELVQSIQYPSLDPNAAEVFYRVIVKNGNGPEVYVDDLLAQLQIPLLLCWGKSDPWIRPAAADTIEALYPALSYRVNIDAGHCPHDESPQEVNAAIRDFMQRIII